MALPFWTNTSSNEVVRRLIGRADETTNAELTILAEGEVVAEPLDLSVVYGQIGSDAAAIWPQLYLAGYVTTHDVQRPTSSKVVRRLEVPNLEVRELFQEELIERAVTAAGGRNALSTLHAALLSDDTHALALEIEQALLATVSYHDLQSENSCHMWLLSLLYGMEGYRFPRSIRKVGRGRPDVIVEPDNAHEELLPAIVVEVKFIRDATEGQLQAAADEALTDQALAKRYAHGLAGSGAVLWSLAFNNHKHVAVAHT